MAYQKVYMNQIHSSSLLSQLSEMWKRDVLCDAIITTGTVNTKAHRLVLVAACPMLQSMDSASIGNKLEVKLSPDINKESVVSFLQYLYDGFMTITEDNIRDIEKIARLLQVESVTKCCNDFYKVLQETVGEGVGMNQKFLFNTNTAEFKHIRTSDLQRLIQNSGAKRNMDSDEISSRKRSKLQKLATNLSKSSGEESFQLIQSEHKKNGIHCLDRPNVQQSLAVSVAGRTDVTDTDVHVVVADDSDHVDNSLTSSLHPLHSSFGTIAGSNATSKLDMLSSRLSPGSFTKPKPLHKPYSPISRPLSASKPKISYPSVPMSDNSHLYKHNKTKDTSADIQGAWTVTRPDKLNSSQSETTSKENQIIIEPMLEEYESMETGSQPTDRPDSPNAQTSMDKSDLSHSNRKEVKEHTSSSSNDKEEDPSNTIQSIPDLSVVKVERESSFLGEGQSMGDGQSASVDENEEEVSDTEYSHHGETEFGHQGDTDYGHYGNTGQTSFTIDDHGSSWYTQTFKDFYDGERNGTGPLADQTVLPQDFYKENDRNTDRQIAPGRTPSALPIQQKLIRALANLKSPMVFLRAIQRKISGIKIDVLKAECTKLASQGFGKFIPKQMSNIVQRDAYFKPAPDQLDQGIDQFLYNAGVSHEFYSNNYNDISQLSEEELHIMCVIHPNKAYVQKLCRNVVDPQNLVIQKLEKMTNIPLLKGGMQPGNFSFNVEQTNPQMNPLSCLEQTASRYLIPKEEKPLLDWD